MVNARLKRALGYRKNPLPVLIAALVCAWGPLFGPGPSPAEASPDEGQSSTSAHLDLGAVGQVKGFSGRATVIRVAGKTEKLEQDTLIFEGDSVDLETGAHARVVLNDAKDEASKSTLVLLPNSKITVIEAKADGPENLREVKIELLRGDLRAIVPPASDPVLPTFHVKLATTRVNVKSGDFIVGLLKTDSEWRNRVQVLSGRATLLTDRSVDGKADFIDIDAHQQSEFIHAKVVAGSSIGTVQQVINHGDFGPVTDLDEDEVARIEQASNAKVAEVREAKLRQAEKRKVVALKRKAKAKAVNAALAASLCHSPNAQFNQCSWTCEGKNPAQAKTCRANAPGVACVRRICRADGVWKEETRLPASEGDLCPAKGVSVHDCGAYW